jgi:type II secretory pathway pseudopilin PulG
MNRRKLLTTNQKGWTLVELMLVAAMIGIITPAMTTLFIKVSQGMAADEMHTQLKTGNQQMLNRIHINLSASRHFFMGDTSGVSFQAALSILSSAPPTIAGDETLAQPQTSVSDSLGASVSDFEPGFIGNAILFGAYDAPETIINASGQAVIYLNSPMTVSGTFGGVTAIDSAGTPKTLIVDLYRFYYYYQTTQISHPIRGVTCTGLVEWQSIRFADAFELEDIADPVLQTNICHWLAEKGVTAGWDPSQTDPSQAFVTFGTSGAVALFAGQAGTYKIPQEQSLVLTRVSSGILSNGFGYGICPNTIGWKDSPPIAVPQYAPTPTTAGAPFPGGFEIGVGGVSAGRKVLVRAAWVAKGASPKVEYNDISMVNAVRDVW